MNPNTPTALSAEQKAEMQRAADALFHADGKPYKVGASDKVWRTYRAAAHPAAVLSLLAENAAQAKLIATLYEGLALATECSRDQMAENAALAAQVAGLKQELAEQELAKFKLIQELGRGNDTAVKDAIAEVGAPSAPGRQCHECGEDYSWHCLTCQEEVPAAPAGIEKGGESK